MLIPLDESFIRVFIARAESSQKGRIFVIRRPNYKAIELKPYRAIRHDVTFNSTARYL